MLEKTKVTSLTLLRLLWEKCLLNLSILSDSTNNRNVWLAQMKVKKSVNEKSYFRKCLYLITVTQTTSSLLKALLFWCNPL